MAELSFIQTKKTVSETLSDLRVVFKKYGIEEWEPMPVDGSSGYAVRYFRNKNWTEIKSTFQPTKAMNLRICYQVIFYMFSWESRGVSGIVKGTAFMGSDVAVTTNNGQESFDEACAILGVEPGASLEEVEHVHKVKVQYAHPDKFIDPEEKKRATERFKRIENAYALIKKVKASK
jgi:DnaJ-domain-containing protein 1